MARNASGSYSLPAGNPVVGGTTIQPTWANTTLADIAAEVTDSLSRSGKGGMLAPLGLVDGSAGAPGIAFASELTTGMYRAAAGDLRFAVSGTQRARLTATGLEIAGGITATGAVAATGAVSGTTGTFSGAVTSAGADLRNAGSLNAGTLLGARFDDSSHGNRGGGSLHSAVVSGGASGFMTGADKASLDTLMAALSDASGSITWGVAKDFVTKTAFLYKTVDGIVVFHVYGTSQSNGLGNGVQYATFPVGYRPVVQIAGFGMETAAFAYGRCTLGTDGAFKIYSSSYNTTDAWYTLVFKAA